MRQDPKTRHRDNPYMMEFSDCDVKHQLNTTFRQAQTSLKICKIQDFDNYTASDRSEIHSEFHRTMKVSKDTKIRNRFNQVPHLTKDTEVPQFPITQFCFHVYRCLQIS